MIDLSLCPQDQPLRIIIGAGEQRWGGWTPTQGHDLNLLKEEDWSASFADRHPDSLLCEHVFEHLSLEEGKEAAKRCYRYLRPGGRMRAAVPDKHFRNEDYQRLAQVGGPGPPDHPAASHRIVYDYVTFRHVFEEAGFVVTLLEYCDEEGVFHHREWDIGDGPIYRSWKMDHRNADGELNNVSIILDAIKPLENGTHP